MRTVLWLVWPVVVSLVLLEACQATKATPAPPLTLAEMASPSTEAEDPFRPLRDQMVEADIMGRGVADPRVLAAMRSVPRHLFVPERYRGHAYEDRALPIAEGQTISQPYIVALMSELLEVSPGARVLEVGTGSGYQAAILARMGAEVYSVEIIPNLASEARKRLDRLDYGSVRTQLGDGYYGWEDMAPFDGIIVTAAPDHVPPPLLRQLKSTGKMVIPVGPTGSVQTLWLIKQRDGEWVFLNQGPVRFVPLLGQAPP